MQACLDRDKIQRDKAEKNAGSPHVILSPILIPPGITVYYAFVITDNKRASEEPGKV